MFLVKLKNEMLDLPAISALVKQICPELLPVRLTRREELLFWGVMLWLHLSTKLLLVTLVTLPNSISAHGHFWEVFTTL